MAFGTLRDMVIALSPPWYQKTVGGGILYAMATVCDGLIARTNEGVKLRMPGVGSPTALGAIGNDRVIERGPYQTDEAYVPQLKGAYETWQVAGSPYAILPQLRFYFLPNTPPTVRTVTNAGVWHEVDGSNVVTKHIEGNWNWNDHPERWWWGWVIIDGSNTWSMDYWNLPGDWGDGGVWGSNMTEYDARSLKRIVKKWMGGNNRAQIIIIFDADLFKKENAIGDNVDGTGEDADWRQSVLANFFEQLVHQ